MDWFRMYGEFASDPKVQMLSEAMQRRLVMLFCLECSNGIETFHETERETSIAFALRISPQDMAETKELFLRKGFINEDWTVRNWSSRQYASDSSTARVRKHRQEKKQKVQQGETLPNRSSNAPEQNRTEQNRTEQNRTEQKELPLPPKGDATADAAPVPDGGEEIITAPPKPDDLEGFAGFWLQYPKKKSKQDAEKAWKKLKPNAELRARMLQALAAQSKTEDWTKSRGQFIPLPATWLNGRRWEDEVEPPPLDRHHGFNGERNYPKGLEAKPDGTYRI